MSANYTSKIANLKFTTKNVLPRKSKQIVINVTVDTSKFENLCCILVFLCELFDYNY